MENENKIATEVEEVLNSIMEEITEDVAAEEAVDGATEEVVENEAVAETVEETEEIEEADNGSLYGEVVTTKKIEPYGASTCSVVSTVPAPTSISGNSLVILAIASAAQAVRKVISAAGSPPSISALASGTASSGFSILITGMRPIS